MFLEETNQFNLDLFTCTFPKLYVNKQSCFETPKFPPLIYKNKILSHAVVTPEGNKMVSTLVIWHPLRKLWNSIHFSLHGHQEEVTSDQNSKLSLQIVRMLKHQSSKIYPEKFRTISKKRIQKKLNFDI